MPIQTTTLQPSAIGTRYATRYQRGAQQYRYYDQFAGNIMSDSQYNLETRRGMGTTYTFAFASRLTPGSTAISETADVVPQIIRDATSTVSTTSLGEAVKWSQLLTVESFMDEWAQRAEVVGINAIESIENQAIAAGLQGSLVIRTAARASLDAGTTTHNFTEAAIWQAGAHLADLKAPMYVDETGGQNWMACYHTDCGYDLVHGGNLVNVALYQDKMLLLNGEVGKVNKFRLIETPFAKVFYGAGIDNGSAVATTLSDASALALDTTMVVASSTNVSVGRHLAVGTEETGNTFYPTNETVKWVSGTTTITFVGAGANGGFRFDHANGEAVNNNDNVYPVLFGSPNSLVKVYANDVGEFGEMVGPLTDGLLQQWQSLGWKWFGGYGRVSENRLIRGEYSSSLDA
jgi:N4-gp56 family major capsid protein